MALRLTPRDNAFYRMFVDAGDNLVAAADLLSGLMEPNASWTLVAKKMHEVENSNDTVTHRILRQLNTSFVTPFDREDIYRLAGALDDVIDHLDSAVDMADLSQPNRLPALMGDQIYLIQRAAVETAEAMKRLRTLKDIEPYLIEVNRLENEADKVYRKLLVRLFSGDYEPLVTMKLKAIADDLEEATDALEHVAHAVETIAVKES